MRISNGRIDGNTDHAQTQKLKTFQCNHRLQVYLLLLQNADTRDSFKKEVCNV